MTRHRVRPESTRWPELDGVRAFAALAVLLYHTGWHDFQGGFLGVDVFFTLSGFLITSVLLREHQRTGRIRLPRFYLRRALRLTPPLAAMLLLALGWSLAGEPTAAYAHQTLEGLPYAATYLSNWALIFTWAPPPLGIIGHTWTLSVEEQFYLLWPLILLVLLRSRLPRWPIAAGLAAAAGGEAVLRVMLIRTPFGARHLHLYYFFGAFYSLGGHSDGLILGCALAFAVGGPRRGTRTTSMLGGAVRGLIGMAGVVVLAVMVARTSNISRFPGNGGFLLVDAATAAVIYAVVTGPPFPLRALLGTPPVRYLGRISYGIYLWHYPILIVAEANPRIAHHLLLLWFCRLVVPVVFAAFSYEVIERPFRALRARADTPPTRAPAEPVPVPVPVPAQSPARAASPNGRPRNRA